MCRHANRPHTHVKDSTVHVRVRRIVDTPKESSKITQHALKIVSLQTVEILRGHCSGEEGHKTRQKMPVEQNSWADDFRIQMGSAESHFIV